MQRIKCEPGNRFYGFYSRTGGYELRNFAAGTLVSKAVIKRFNISKEFLEPKKSKTKKSKTKK